MSHRMNRKRLLVRRAERAGRSGGETVVKATVKIFDREGVIDNTITALGGKSRFMLGQVVLSKYRGEQQYADLVAQIARALVKKNLAEEEGDYYYIHGLGYLDDASSIALNVLSESTDHAAMSDARVTYTVDVVVPKSATWSG